jgi:hypothetical protein
VKEENDNRRRRGRETRRKTRKIEGKIGGNRGAGGL